MLLLLQYNIDRNDGPDYNKDYNYLIIIKGCVVTIIKTI